MSIPVNFKTHSQSRKDKILKTRKRQCTPQCGKISRNSQENSQAWERQPEPPAPLFQLWLRSYGDTCWGTQMRNVNYSADTHVRPVGLHPNLERWAEIKLFHRGNVNSTFPARQSVTLYNTFDKLSEECSPDKSVYLHGWLSFLVLTIPSATEKTDSI